MSTANGHGLVGPETRGKLVQTHKGGRGVEGKPETPTRHRPLRIEREAGQDPSTRKWHECPEHGWGKGLATVLEAIRATNWALTRRQRQATFGKLAVTPGRDLFSF